MREEIEFTNLAKEFTHYIIKRECWDKMLVKGRSLCAFNSSMEVSNFPMKERSSAVLKELEKVQMRRKLEILDSKANKEFADAAVIKPTVSLFCANSQHISFRELSFNYPLIIFQTKAGSEVEFARKMCRAIWYNWLASFFSAATAGKSDPRKVPFGGSKLLCCSSMSSVKTSC